MWPQKFFPSGDDIAGRRKNSQEDVLVRLDLNFPDQWLLAMSDFNMGYGLICLSEKLADFGRN